MKNEKCVELNDEDGNDEIYDCELMRRRLFNTKANNNKG